MKLAATSIASALLALSAQAEEKTTPFSGTPSTIPGLIEAEHWDKGEPGVAYADEDEQNRGEDYREPTQVDIEKRPDASNGHGVGWTKPGEWLIYTVDGADEDLFLETLGECCERTGFRIWAWVLMRNQYYLLIQTPAANLVEGMGWLQN